MYYYYYYYCYYVAKKKYIKCKSFSTNLKTDSPLGPYYCVLCCLDFEFSLESSQVV